MAWCSASLMILDACLCVIRNSSRVGVALVFLFWICGSVVMPYVYSLSRYCWAFVLSLYVRLMYFGLDLHVCSSGVFFDGECTICGGDVYFVFSF